MKFFNPKEEVLDIQLTQYGKKLLANGQFKPAYYAFFDNDILYDPTYAGAPEHQNKTVPRIRDKTPRLHTQTHFDTLDEADKAWLPEWADEDWIPVEQASLDLKALGLPLGTSDYGNNYAPSWNVEYLYGELGESVNYYSGSIHFNSIPKRHAAGTGAPRFHGAIITDEADNDFAILSGSLMYWPIPQLKSTIEWETFVTYFDSNGDLVKDYIPLELQDIVEDMNIFQSAPEGSDPAADNAVEDVFNSSFADGSLIQVKPDFLLLEIAENNVEFLKENFDIEVFTLHRTLKANGREYNTERRLHFFDPEIDSEPGPQHVEYWFDITVDEQIPAEYFCASDVVVSKKKKLRTDQTAIYPDCPDLDNARNLYKKDLEDVGEPC